MTVDSRRQTEDGDRRFDRRDVDIDGLQMICLLLAYYFIDFY